MENMSGQGNGRQPIRPPPENNNNRLPPPPSQPPKKCPRCFSFNTRFCYYNNGCSLQPRYLCKSCKRHWTVGGALRNIPIGGGSRKDSKRLVKGSPSSHDASSSCSTYHIGESSRSQEGIPPPQPSPSPPPAPPLPPNIIGYSNMSLPPANSLYSAPAGENLPSFPDMQNLNGPQGLNQAPLNGVGSISGERSTIFSFLQGFPRNQNLIGQQQAQQSNYQTLQNEETMAQQSFFSNFWSRGLITNVAWAENMLLQPSNNIIRSGSARPSADSDPNERPDDVDEDDFLPGCGPPPPSS